MLGYCDKYIPLSAKRVLPNPLPCLLNQENLTLTFPEQLVQAETIYEQYSFTEEMAHNKEVHTKERALFGNWFQKRAGCVTASRLVSCLY